MILTLTDLEFQIFEDVIEQKPRRPILDGSVHHDLHSSGEWEDEGVVVVVTLDDRFQDVPHGQPPVVVVLFPDLDLVSDAAVEAEPKQTVKIYTYTT